MRLSVRNGLKMITTTHYFSWNNRNTQLLDKIILSLRDKTILPQEDQKNVNLLFKQIITASLNKLNSAVIPNSTPLYCYNRSYFMLLYRKENSELDFYYRHNV